MCTISSPFCLYAHTHAPNDDVAVTTFLSTHKSSLIYFFFFFQLFAYWNQALYNNTLPTPLTYCSAFYFRQKALTHSSYTPDRRRWTLTSRLHNKNVHVGRSILGLSTRWSIYCTSSQVGSARTTQVGRRSPQVVVKRKVAHRVLGMYLSVSTYRISFLVCSLSKLLRETMLYNSTKCDQQGKRHTIVH